MYSKYGHLLLACKRAVILALQITQFSPGGVSRETYMALIFTTTSLTTSVLSSLTRYVPYPGLFVVHGPDFYNHFPNNIRPIFPHQIYVPYPGLFVVHGPDFYNHFPNNIRPIFPHQICAVPRFVCSTWP